MISAITKLLLLWAELYIEMKNLVGFLSKILLYCDSAGHRIGSGFFELDSYENLFFSKQEFVQNFKKYTDGSLDALGLNYDYRSIMHYDRLVFFSILLGIM